MDFTSLAIGCFGGIVSTRLYLWLEPRCISAYRKWRAGICLRYLPTGVRENRDGTISDFCQRCGHPAGYHFH